MENRMELEVKRTMVIFLDVIMDYLREENLTPEEAVNLYIQDMDECDWLFFTTENREKIIKKVKEMLDKQ